VETLDSDDEGEEQTQISTYKKGQDVGKIPKGKKPTKSSTNGSQPGVMYLGRIPHGFYEHEIRAYFGQFGEITRLRVVRNKKTGASRHRAFIEFADAEVADIAARTMDKYLLFGHILTAKIVPPSQVHPELFKGANRRFKVVPWNQMAGRQLERPLSESQWQARISKEEQRRASRAEKLKAMGYEFEAPKLKPAEAKPLLENNTEEAPKAIEAAPPAEHTKATDKEIEAAKSEEAKPTEEATPQKKKGKKGKKTKS
jgi:nucleolar protein 15